MIRAGLIILMAALLVACATTNKRDDDIAVVPGGVGHSDLNANQLTYNRLRHMSNSDEEEDMAPVSDPYQYRTEGQDNTLGEPGLDQSSRILVSQTDAWWLNAPQFEPPKVLRRGTLKKNVAIPKRFLGTKTVVRVNLDEDGQVARLQILEGIDPELDEVCLNMVSRTRFSPAMWKGLPLKFTFLIPCYWGGHQGKVIGPEDLVPH